MHIEAVKVVVIGGGVTGLAHAFQAARRGYSVALLERDRFAQGASIRNFGMIWSVGQTAENHPIALRSREIWLSLAKAAGLWARECGSIHLAHRQDELAVLEEFSQAGPPLGYECAMITPAEALRQCPSVNPVGLLGGLFSPTEVNVDPREAIARLPRWLAEAHGSPMPGWPRWA